MADDRDPAGDGEAQDGSGAKVGLWHRFLLALPSAKRDAQKPTLGERLSGAVLKPANPDSPTATPDKPETVEEAEHAVRYADDTQRLIGLVAAPLMAVIALVVVSNQITHDPKHTSTYHGLELMFLVMALLEMAAAWYRKRLFMGIILALYGLAIFNLHYWEFGIPFVLAGAWYLVRAYRAQRDLKAVTAGGHPGGAPRANGSGPPQSKRYTPPTPPKRQKPQDKRQAG
jgi:hypothetical protein